MVESIVVIVMDITAITTTVEQDIITTTIAHIATTTMDITNVVARITAGNIDKGTESTYYLVSVANYIFPVSALIFTYNCT